MMMMMMMIINLILYDWCAVTTAIEANNSVQFLAFSGVTTTKTLIKRTSREYKGTYTKWLSTNVAHGNSVTERKQQ
jgi:hypothetical protein